MVAASAAVVVVRSLAEEGEGGEEEGETADFRGGGGGDFANSRAQCSRKRRLVHFSGFDLIDCFSKE